MNQLILRAQVLQAGAIRYTPAGLMALDLGLKHEGQAQEAGKPRQVSLEIKAFGVGEICKRLQALGVGAEALFTGFLSHQRNGRGMIFHVTSFEIVPQAVEVTA
ncbi:MAG TPA: primosomal replication protein N [Burkholderiaceae bacterium]